MNMKLSLEQKQMLSQRMIQSVEILQMNVQELDSYLKELTLENPLVELEDNREAPQAKSDLQRKLEWLEAADEQNRVYYGRDYEEEQERDAWNLPAEEENLPQYVLSQLIPLAKDDREGRIYHYLAYSLDSRGYLEDMPQGLCEAFDLSLEEAAEYLRVFQSVEPAGWGRRISRSACCCSCGGRTGKNRWRRPSSAATWNCWGRTSCPGLPPSPAPPWTRWRMPAS